MLMIFVRHTKLCLKTRLASKGLSKEALRLYKHCDCPKWYRGTHDGKTHPRATLSANSWEAAERALVKIKEGGRPEIAGVSVEKTVGAWLEEVELNHAAVSTIKQWTVITNKLLKFCDRRRIHSIANLDAVAINQWRGEWSSEKHHKGIGLKPNTAETRITVLKLLFKFARRMRWIKEDPMWLVKVVSVDHEEDDGGGQTMPLDEEGDMNYRALLAAIPRHLASLRRHVGVFAGRERHLAAITELMYETGLRWSDAFRFEHRKMTVDTDGWGTYTAKQFKTKRKGKRSLVTIAVPPHLVRTMAALAPLSPGHLFWDGAMKPATLYRQVWIHLKGAGALAGIPDVRPHRLRDSFAVNRLNEGMLMQDVSKLLGHTSIAITERYYAPFVKSRKDALIATRKALAGAPPATAKVVAIKKRA